MQSGEPMTLEVVALVITLVGALAMGLVHNPHTLVMGLIAIPVGMALMFFCGWRRGKLGAKPS